MWRDFNGDFGIDLLKKHYKNSKHNHKQTTTLNHYRNKPAVNMGIATSVAGRYQLRPQFTISSGFGGRSSVVPLVFILYF